jgi:hypothetical protein
MRGNSLPEESSSDPLQLLPRAPVSHCLLSQLSTCAARHECPDRGTQDIGGRLEVALRIFLSLEDATISKALPVNGYCPFDKLGPKVRKGA